MGHYCLHISGSLPGPELREAEWAVSILRGLRYDLDQEFLAARIIAKRDLVVPVRQDLLWPFWFFRSRADLLLVVGSDVTFEGTGIYKGPRDERPFFAFVPSGDVNLDRRNLLAFGVQQILYERTGLLFDASYNATGSCFPLGLITYFRQSFLPKGRKGPALYGGIPESSLQAAQRALRSGRFPSLRQLFFMHYDHLVSGRSKYAVDLRDASVLLVDFLHNARNVAAGYMWKAAQEYATRGLAPKEFPLSVLIHTYRGVYRNRKVMEEQFFAYIMNGCEAVNKAKWTSPAARGAAGAPGK